MNKSQPHSTFKQLYKIVLALVFILANPIAVKAEDLVVGVIPILDQFCVAKSEKTSITVWSKQTENIFVGTVNEVRSRFDNAQGWANQCWANFEITENFKGAKTKNIWLRIFYDAHDFPYGGKMKDFRDIKYCPVISGKKYLVFSKNKKPTDALKWPFFTVGYSDAHNCTPIIPIENASKALKVLRATR